MMSIIYRKICCCCCCLVAKSCLTLCDSVDCSPQGCSVHGVFQARILGWVAIPFSMGSFWPRGKTLVSHIASRLPSELPWNH